MDIKGFLDVAKHLPAEHSVLVRGRHGIGKSQVIYQLSKFFGLPVMERRLSQVTEGDMVGLPWLEGEGAKGATKFMPPDWFMDCVNKPHVIFLDEINRATPEVMQAAFELVLDRRIQGREVHKDCRIYAAINASAEYQINDMDPALLDRFFVIDLDPTIEDWVAWGREHVHPCVVDFILQHPKHLEHTEAIEPGRIYPSRRSWDRLNTALAADAGNGMPLIDVPDDGRFYGVCMGFVGPEAANQLVSFVRESNAHISAADVLDKFSKVEKRLKKLSNDKHNAVIEKVDEHCKKNEWTKEQAENCFKYMEIMPAELRIALWTKICNAGGEVKNVVALHKFAKDLILKTINTNLEQAKKNDAANKKSK